MGKNEVTGKYVKVYVDVGKVKMERIEGTKYLGSIIQSNDFNEKQKELEEEQVWLIKS